MAVSLGADGTFEIPEPFSTPWESGAQEEEHPLLSATADSPRHAIELAEAINATLRHENHGSLSFSHGFAPALTPAGTGCLPPPFDAWADLARRLPALYSSGRLRSFVDDKLPDLTEEVERLDSAFPRHLALLAANVLGTVLGSYWNIAGVRPPSDRKLLPNSLYGPWKAIVARYLGRDLGKTGFGMYEALILGFEYDDPGDAGGKEHPHLFLPPPPKPEHKCQWQREGRHEYDPTMVRILKTKRTCSLTGSTAEKVFFGSFYEMNCRGSPIVRLLVEAQEAAVVLGKGQGGKGQSVLQSVDEEAVDDEDEIPLSVLSRLSVLAQPSPGDRHARASACPEANRPEAREARERLLAALRALRANIDLLTFETFASIQQMSASDTHVNAVHWSKLAPIFDPVVARHGPTGAATPLFLALDAFFGRKVWSNYIGEEEKKQVDIMPVNWKRYVEALAKGTPVGSVVTSTEDKELKGVYASCFRSWASEEGFLGRHFLKMAGYLDVSMKVGRSKTPTYSGLLKNRTWEKIAILMRNSLDERCAVKVDAQSILCHSVRAIVDPDALLSKGDTGESCFHVRLDIQGAGIDYRPGDRVGILWESDAALVQETILALAGGDHDKARKLSSTPVVLNNTWKTALRRRPRYHDAVSVDDPILPTSLPLQQFLQYARLRPVSRETLHAAYCGTLDPWLLQFRESGREDLLTSVDVIKILHRSHYDLVKMLFKGCPGYESITDTELLLANASNLFQNADMNNDKSLDRNEIIRVFGAAARDSKGGLEVAQLFDMIEEEETGGIGFAEFRKMCQAAVADGALKLIYLPTMCDLFPPIDFRVYSVASSKKACPDELHLCVAKVVYQQADPTIITSPALADLQRKHQRLGGASSYLQKKVLGLGGENKSVVEHFKNPRFKRLTIGRHSSVSVGHDSQLVIKHFQPPCFSLPPPEKRASVIMFAAGSGIAPFRSFWQELAARRSKAAQHNKPLPETPLLVLQATIRSSVPFAKELASLSAAGALEIHVFLSREDYAPDFSSGQPLWRPSKRGYCSKALVEEGQLRARVTRELAHDGLGHMYICSSGGFAQTLMESITQVLGQRNTEIMMANGRLSIEVFTSLKPPESLPEIRFSNLLFMNDFHGREAKIKGSDVKRLPLQFAIDGIVYDISSFESIHPGGRQLLYLYCGADASRPWYSVQHHKAPEVSSMLEMYKAGHLRTANDDMMLARSRAVLDIKEERKGDRKEFRKLASSGLSITPKTMPLQRWYVNGWHPVAQNLVESQNILTMMFAEFWDSNKITAEEPTSKEAHFCIWEGVATYRQKKSVCQAALFSSCHRRLWHELLPTFLGDDFALAIAPLDVGGSRAKLVDIVSSSNHKAAALLVDLLEDMAEKLGKDESNTDGRIPPSTQSLLEAIREWDEQFISLLKASVSNVLRAFEDFDYTAFDREEEDDQVQLLLCAAEQAVSEIAEMLSTFCAASATFVKKYFPGSLAANMDEKVGNEAGGLCQLYTSNDNDLSGEALDKSSFKNVQQ